MEEKKIIEVNAELDNKQHTLKIAAELPTATHYALRVFRDESNGSEIFYRSTRLLNLEHVKDGFVCEAPESIVDKTFEIKSVKTNVLVVKGKVINVTKTEAPNDGTQS